MAGFSHARIRHAGVTTIHQGMSRKNFFAQKIYSRRRKISERLQAGNPTRDGRLKTHQ